MIADLVYVEDSSENVLLFLSEDRHGGGPIWIKVYRDRTVAADDAARFNLLTAPGVEEMRTRRLDSAVVTKVEIEQPKTFLSFNVGWLPWFTENQILH